MRMRMAAFAVFSVFCSALLCSALFCSVLEVAEVRKCPRCAPAACGGRGERMRLVGCCAERIAESIALGKLKSVVAERTRQAARRYTAVVGVYLVSCLVFCGGEGEGGGRKG